MQMTSLAGAPVEGTKNSKQDLGHLTDVSPVLQEHPDNIHVYGLVVHLSVYIVIYNIYVSFYLSKQSLTSSISLCKAVIFISILRQ